MLSHLDAEGRPQIVDVSEKVPTRRVALARGIVELPPEVIAALEDDDIHTKKGRVFETAILAGVMAAKKTSDLIPLCHPIGLEDCKIDIRPLENGHVEIDASVVAYNKTGVEMEALTAVTVASLTIYDMCKALSHNIVIKEVRLIEKRGGKSDYQAQP